MDYSEKVFFNAGDVVRIKQQIDAPDMVISHINKIHQRSSDISKPKLIGITCFWFSTDNKYQCQLFSTKDLIHVSKSDNKIKLPLVDKNKIQK
jgi:uncharacterized protein YodC (DUF2158 family)